MDKINTEEVDAVAQEIVDYLRSHPDAADTVEGVVQWWLIRERYLQGFHQVEAALDLLKQKGLVEERINPDRSRVYAATPAIKPKDEI